MPDNPTTPNISPMDPVSKQEPEIVVMPDKFLGASLKITPPVPQQPAASSQQPAPPKPPPLKPPPAIIRPPARPPSSLPMVLAVVGLVVVVAGVFAYLNRGLLFQKPAPPPAAPVVVIPSAPADLSAVTSTGGSVALAWVDTATDETGIRIERRADAGSYAALTNLPAHSSAFLDVSAEPGHAYAYRIIAMNSAGDSSSSNEAVVSSPSAAPPSPSPSLRPALPPDGLDSDSDSLTDVEEALYGTNPHNADTMNDGYLDGNQIFYLYDPTHKAGSRLIDSGLVKLFSSPAGWSVYVPTKWAAALDAPDGLRAAIATGGQEQLTITVEDNPQNLSPLDWYLSKNPGTVSAQTQPFVTHKDRDQGVLGAGGLDAYFPWGGKILAVRYDLNGAPYVYYRTTFGMMLNSLTLGAAPTSPSSATSTGTTSTAP